MDSAQRLKASKCIHDHCYRCFPFSCIILCNFFLPTMHFYSATSALKMPVKFLTKGALYVFYLLCYDCWIWRNWMCDQSDLWPVMPDYQTLLLYDLQSSDEWQYDEQTMFLNWWRCIDFLAQVVYTDSDIPLSPALVCSLSKSVSRGQSYLSIPHHKKHPLKSSNS